MAKYDKYNMRGNAPKRKWEIHPIWQGIGCILLILIPVMAYAGAAILVKANLEQHWLPMPFEMTRTITVPLLGKVAHFYANLFVAALLTLIGYGFLTMIYSMIYRVAGPPKYGPLDAPPLRRRPKNRRR